MLSLSPVLGFCGILITQTAAISWEFDVDRCERQGVQMYARLDDAGWEQVYASNASEKLCYCDGCCVNITLCWCMQSKMAVWHGRLRTSDRSAHGLWSAAFR